MPSMTEQNTQLAVPPGLMRTNQPTTEHWIESGRFAVELLCRTLDREDLATVELLDVGCGTKLAKTLIDSRMPVGRYTGVDASRPVINWLRAHVTDPRFEFHHLDAHNAKYNPGGLKLDRFDRLPVGARPFEMICLFSVFTHLAPDDYAAMLRLLREHAKPDAALLFSLFVHDPDYTSPYAEAVAAGLESDDPQVRAHTEAAVAEVRRTRDERTRFVDVIPDRPLEVARYDRDYALELVEGSGWEVVGLHPPERFIQHYMVCRAA